MRSAFAFQVQHLFTALEGQKKNLIVVELSIMFLWLEYFYLFIFLANKAATSHVQIFPDDILNYQTDIIQALNPGSEMKEPGWTHLDAVTVR